jgi:hypothetical protein
MAPQKPAAFLLLSALTLFKQNVLLLFFLARLCQNRRIQLGNSRASFLTGYAMPFKSEKQRRFLWSEHPDIAKRWAHEYPNQGKLPMYADKTKNRENTETARKKEAVLRVLRKSLLLDGNLSISSIVKKSDSILKYLEVPHGEKPVAAGEEHVTAKKDEQTAENKPKSENCGGMDLGNKEIAPIVQKLANLFSKHAAVIRLGKRHQTQHSGAPSRLINGIDATKFNNEVARLKQQRLFGANPLPMGAQPAAPPPVASYPGLNSAPQAAPNMAANKPAQQSPAANPIGLKGPLNTKDGVPTFAQNLTGNAAFGKGTA